MSVELSQLITNERFWAYSSLSISFMITYEKTRGATIKRTGPINRYWQLEALAARLCG